jgi:hypothetical protein
LSQSWGFKPQGRNWIYCIINDCPGLRGRHCILQGMVKIMVSKKMFDLKRKKLCYLWSWLKIRHQL